jgi:hypothetical protein
MIWSREAPDVNSPVGLSANVLQLWLNLPVALGGSKQGKGRVAGYTPGTPDKHHRTVTLPALHDSRHLRSDAAAIQPG